MLIKITATTETEAISKAKKKSSEYPAPLYLFYCKLAQEYTISDLAMPYAPIFEGGYVPALVECFSNCK